MFYNSMSDIEKKHIIEAFSFELGKVSNKDIRQQVVEMFGHVNIDMMTEVAKNIGVDPPTVEEVKYDKISPALSQEDTIRKPDTLKIGFIVGEGFDRKALDDTMNTLKNAKVQCVVISENLSPVKDQSGGQIEPKETFSTTHAVLLDGIYVDIGNSASDKVKKETMKFIEETYMHFKPMAVTSGGEELLKPDMKDQPGVVTQENMGISSDRFLEAVAQHRHWDRNTHIV